MAQSSDLRAYARQAAQRYGVNPDVFVRQIEQESGFDPTQVSPAGARGIAQIVPQYHPGVNPDDPVASLDYAARLMANHLQQYGGDYALALAAYNAGPGAVAQYGGVPPYEETQTYIQNILGAQGGGQMASASTKPDPNAVVDEGQVQIPDPQNDSADITVYQRKYADGRIEQWTWRGEPIQPVGGFLGIGQTYPDTNKGEWIRDGFVSTDKEQAAQYKAEVDRYQEEQKTSSVSAPSNQRQIGTRQADGSIVWEDNPNYEPDTAGASIITPSTNQQKIGIRKADGSIQWIDNPNYVAPTGPTLAPRYPEDVESAQLGNQLTRLQIQGAERALLPEQQQLIQNLEQTIEYVKGQIASGKMSPKEGDEWIARVQANLEAGLQGATPWQQEEAKREQKNLDRQLGQSILNQRVQSSSSLAQGLLSGALGANYRLRPGESLNLDPLAVAKSYIDEVGGGAELSEMAKALVMGAMQGGTSPMGGQGAQQPMGGTQPSGGGQFPTTREEVLRMYPELANA